MRKFKSFLTKILAVFMSVLLLIACSVQLGNSKDEQEGNNFQTSHSEMIDQKIIKGKSYDEPQDVVDYINLYNELPSNFISKKEAKALGWQAEKGNLWDVAPAKSIGGDYFGNYEGLLPEKVGREYYELDIHYQGGHRQAERLIYSNDGLYFYTADHYKHFEEIQPKEE